MITLESEIIDSRIRAALSVAGVTDFTEVQAQSLPHSLEGRDVMAQAATGSGKTYAFAIPCLNKLDVSLNQPQALILCPTRELAEQVTESIRQLARQIENLKVLTLCGGYPMGPQIKSLSHGCHIVVGTPGRVMDHVMKRRLDLSAVACRVLDEADRMLDMGFADDLEVIFKEVPHTAQTLLFSATFSSVVETLAHTMMRDPAVVKATSSNRISDKVSQQAFSLGTLSREQALMAAITHHRPAQAIVFCNTKAQTARVAQLLHNEGFAVAPIQGDMEQRERAEVMTAFVAKAITTLVATDVAARGLDIPAVDCVINYDVSEDADTHIHRVGRTGRADTQGLALTLFDPADEVALLRIENETGQDIPRKGAQSLQFNRSAIEPAPFQCMILGAGKKQKLRAGDFLGALTKDADIDGNDIGKITVQQNQSIVAVKARSLKRALRFFKEGKIKGKRVRARKLTIDL